MSLHRMHSLETRLHPFAMNILVTSLLMCLKWLVTTTFGSSELFCTHVKANGNVSAIRYVSASSESDV